MLVLDPSFNIEFLAENAVTSRRGEARLTVLNGSGKQTRRKTPQELPCYLRDEELGKWRGQCHEKSKKIEQKTKTTLRYICARRGRIELAALGLLDEMASMGGRKLGAHHTINGLNWS